MKIHDLNELLRELRLSTHRKLLETSFPEDFNFQFTMQSV